MPLLDDATWQRKIYSSGWVDGSGEPYPVVSPSTGEQLGTMGLATPDDVRRAAATAAAAQRDWAAAPYNERAAVLRRAGDLWHANAEEITGWLMRETGAIGPFGGFQIMTSAEECYEAAALASAPYGELLAVDEPPAEHGPAGAGRRGRGHRAVQRADDPVHPRGGAGARARQRGAAQAGPPHGGQPAERVFAEIFAQAGLPDGLLHVLPGGVDVGEALVTDPPVRVISFTGSTRAGRRGGDAWRRSTSSGCTSSWAATRRC